MQRTQKTKNSATSASLRFRYLTFPRNAETLAATNLNWEDPNPAWRATNLDWEGTNLTLEASNLA